MRLKDKGKTKDDESKGGKPHAEVLSRIPTYHIRSNPMDGQMDKELERTQQNDCHQSSRRVSMYAHRRNPNFLWPPGLLWHLDFLQLFPSLAAIPATLSSSSFLCF
jgi:hypothetical protein